MDSKELLGLKDEQGVDFVEGRILPSYKDYPDMPTEKTSQQSGKVELCQDIVLELADRTKVVVAFWNLSQRCFGRDGSLDDHVAFDNTHVRKWIRVRDTNPRQKHSLSRRVKGRAPEHYKKKFGIGVYLKATPTVAVEWMLEEGEAAPRMCAPRRVKKMKPLEAPGSKKAGGANTMSNDSNEVPGARRGGSNQGQSRGDPAPQGGQSRGTPPTTRPPTEQPAAAPPAKTQEEATGEKAVAYAGKAHASLRSSLQNFYIDAKCHVSDQFLTEASRILLMHLTMWKGPLGMAKFTLLSAKPEQIKHVIHLLAHRYFHSHMKAIAMIEKGEINRPDDENGVRIQATSVFNSSLDTFPVQLPR